MTEGARVCAIIPAAGAGTRMGPAAPAGKPLAGVGGTPVIVRTLKAFQDSPEVDDIVIAARPAEIGAIGDLARGAGIAKLREIVPGGSERQDSVRICFSTPAGKGAGVIVVHDAARPFVKRDLIARVVRAALATGAAVAAVRPKDTIKIREGDFLRTPERESCWLAQTPQGFRREVFAEALDRAEKEGFRGTDDVSLIERLGKSVTIVEGSYENIKITTPGDLGIAELIARG